MKRTNNNIILFIVAFCFLSNFSLFSQTLIQSDFEKLVNDHPLMKRHDSKTGFFKNTAYDRSFDQDYLRAENASLTLELEKIQQQRKAYEEKMLSDNESEDSLWNNIAELDNKKNEIEKKIEKNTQLAFNYSDGDILDLVNIIDKISEESILPLYINNHVVLNKLPKYVPEVPDIKDDDLRRFFYKADSDILKKYLRYTYAIGLMFDEADEPILYNGSVQGSIAVIDFSKVLALHPRMALFDFNRFGFYKVKNVNLSENEFDEEIFKLTSSSVDNNAILSNLEKEIEEIDKNIKDLNEKENSEEKIKEYYNKKSELESKKEEIEYLQANCDLTDLEETKKILSEIKSEVLSVISDYAKNNKIEIVINVSEPRLDVYEKSLSGKSGRLVNLFNLSELYSLLYDNYASASVTMTKVTSEAILNHLSIVKDPILTDVVFDKNIPFVIYGGEKIDSYIINKIYSKYSIKESVTAKIHLYKEEVLE